MVYQNPIQNLGELNEVNGEGNEKLLRNRNCRAGGKAVIIVGGVYAEGNKQSPPFEGPPCVGTEPTVGSYKGNRRQGSSGQGIGQ